MSETTYHVGCGIAGIYAGTLKKSGDEWRQKNDVTHEALQATAQHLFFHNKEYRFSYDGECYVMRIEKMEVEHE